MKITDLTRKLRAALVAGGMLAPATLLAADLNTNLIVNPGFENVDLNSVSYYNAPQILDWSGPIPGFAYSHDLAGEMVPDFANGGPLAGGDRDGLDCARYPRRRADDQPAARVVLC